METKKVLTMNFKTSEDKKLSIAVDNPRADITESEIKAVMATIVENDIFAPGGGSIVDMVDAKVVETGTVEYDLV